MSLNAAMPWMEIKKIMLSVKKTEPKFNDYFNALPAAWLYLVVRIKVRTYIKRTALLYLRGLLLHETSKVQTTDCPKHIATIQQETLTIDRTSHSPLTPRLRGCGDVWRHPVLSLGNSTLTLTARRTYLISIRVTASSNSLASR